MKRIKFYCAFDWILVAIAFVAALLLYNGGMLYSRNPETVDLFNQLTVLGLILYGVLIALQLPIYIMGIVNGIISKNSMAKHNMIVKLVSIPFFAINFIAFLGFSADISKNYSWIAVLVVILSVIGTFFIMFRTSFPDIIYFIKSYIKKTLKPTGWSILALIMLFIFCLDVVGEIILFNHERNQRPDIAAKIREQRLRKIEEWKVKKHKSLLAFKIKSLITSAILTISCIGILVIFILAAKNLVDSPFSFVNWLDNTWLVLPLIIIGISTLYKFIIGIRYGKHGEENPLNFLFVMKMIDLVPTIILLSIAVFCLLAGVMMDLWAILLISCIVVVVVLFVIISFLVFSMAAYASALPPMVSALLCIWSTSLTAFTYLVNQRAMKNRKFSSPIIIVCLIFLWIPILDIPAMVILKRKAKNNLILGDTPVIIA